ncbi:hypothetical protein YC2023_060917 [Brassica napus]
MHLVSLRSFVEFRTDPTNFSAKSSQIGLLLGVAQSPRASHQELLSGNSPTASYWCINVDFDYQLFFCLNLSTKTKLRYQCRSSRVWLLSTVAQTQRSLELATTLVEQVTPDGRVLDTEKLSKQIRIESSDCERSNRATARERSAPSEEIERVTVRDRAKRLRENVLQRVTARDRVERPRENDLRRNGQVTTERSAPSEESERMTARDRAKRLHENDLCRVTARERSAPSDDRTVE